MKLRVIVNPRAGSGTAARRLPDIRRALERAGLVHEVAETEGPGDARVSPAWLGRTALNVSPSWAGTARSTRRPRPTWMNPASRSLAPTWL